MFPSDSELNEAARLIRSGRLVAFPTETVYGLGANALDEAAVARIYEAKGRPATSPLIVHVASKEAAREITAEWPELAECLAAKFWPGPLTLVLPKREAIPATVTAGLETVGVRVPGHAVALGLLERAKVPIAAPSANRFGELSPTTAAHVRASLGDRVDMVLDGGPTDVGIESTVVSLDGAQPMVLRPGMIGLVELEAATRGIDGIAWGSAQTREMAENVAKGLARGFASPGLQARHYAPATPLYVLAPGTRLPKGRGRVIEMPAEPVGYARSLYARLHEADGEGWDWIAVRRPPQAPEWAAIHDRLKRAATG
jgi:L-threonylcarbamoyladenylate synthase